MRLAMRAVTRKHKFPPVVGFTCHFMSTLIFAALLISTFHYDILSVPTEYYYANAAKGTHAWHNSAEFTLIVFSASGFSISHLSLSLSLIPLSSLSLLSLSAAVLPPGPFASTNDVWQVIYNPPNFDSLVR